MTRRSLTILMVLLFMSGGTIAVLRLAPHAGRPSAAARRSHHSGQRPVSQLSSSHIRAQIPLSYLPKTNNLPRWEQTLFRAGTVMGSVPRTIPRGGVAVTNGISAPTAADGDVMLYAQPATSAPLLTPAEAGQDALNVDNGPGLSIASTVFANVSVADDQVPAGVTPPSSDVLGQNVWIVVVRAPQPEQMPTGCTPFSANSSTTSTTACPTVTVQDDVLLISDTTGQMLYGYFSD